MKRFIPLVVLFQAVCAGQVVSPSSLDQRSLEYWQEVAGRLMNTGLVEPNSFELLHELVSGAPGRLSGSESSRKAIEITRNMMEKQGFENIRLQPVMVPLWVRGDMEEAVLYDRSGVATTSLSVCALGGSVGTPDGGTRGEVIEVTSFDELRSLGETVKGKVVFFNRPMDPTKLNTREAYRGAVSQRNLGAIEAAAMGGIAVVVRSMTLADDDVPHTGMVLYRDSVRAIPAVAISTHGANLLSRLIKEQRDSKLTIRLSCENKGMVRSSNVIGEIRGREFPNEVILIGAHLDSWDKGNGAHDDGAGCVQVIEALALIKRVGLQPKRTIRVVLFENEEMGVRGGLAYRDSLVRNNEVHVAVVESDHGGFAPRGFTYEGDSPVSERVLALRPVFEAIDAGRFVKDYPGVDIMPMVEMGITGFGLDPENHRYFDYHHSDNDTIDKVNPRELEMGAVAIALLAFVVSER